MSPPRVATSSGSAARTHSPGTSMTSSPIWSTPAPQGDAASALDQVVDMSEAVDGVLPVIG
jgi:hypothetical protein